MTSAPKQTIRLPSFKPLFPLGEVTADAEALELIEKAGQSPIYFLSRHVTGDWTETSPDDAALNLQALSDGSRILSTYCAEPSKRVVVLTEGDRSSTKMFCVSP